MPRAEFAGIMRMPLFDSSLSLLPLACLALIASAEATETITATAQVKTAGGVEASAPVTITIDRLSSDSERDAIMAALTQGGTTGVRDLLAKRDRIGSVQVGSVVTAIKYAYARPSSDGRLITVVTGSPIAFLGAGVPGASPDRQGFDLGLVLLELSTSGPGRGEIVPATKIRRGDQGGIVTDDYSAEVVRLSNVTGK